LFSSFPLPSRSGEQFLEKKNAVSPHGAETFAGSFGEEREDFGEHMAESVRGFSDGK